jgi:hypothetical protein
MGRLYAIPLRVTGLRQARPTEKSSFITICYNRHPIDFKQQKTRQLLGGLLTICGL